MVGAAGSAAPGVWLSRSRVSLRLDRWLAGVLALGAVATAALGIVCVAYPLHLGSAGTAGGTAMILWAVLLVGSSLMPRAGRGHQDR